MIWVRSCFSSRLTRFSSRRVVAFGPLPAVAGGELVPLADHPKIIATRLRARTAQVDPERPVIITAQGLLPYFERDEVHRMLTAWARLLPGAWLLFDAVTAHLREVRRRNPLPDGYRPPMELPGGRSR